VLMHHELDIRLLVACQRMPLILHTAISLSIERSFGSRRTFHDKLYFWRSLKAHLGVFLWTDGGCLAVIMGGLCYGFAFCLIFSGLMH
jgi:hypothetical protein